MPIIRYLGARIITIRPSFIIIIIGVFSLWIRMAFPIFAIGSARFDDALFVRQAAEIGMGHWLGSYDNLTHAKGIGYSFFILINHATGLPLKLSEHLVFLCVSAFFSVTVGHLYRSRLITLIIFLFLAFIPTAWTAGEGGRVIRESLYISQSLALIALAIHCWVNENRNLVSEQFRAKWGALVLMGVVSGWFWITREEGVWLLPAMLWLMIYWGVCQNWRQQWSSILKFLSLPLIVAFLAVNLVNLVNYKVYGTYLNNDFRSESYKSGYGSLTRIKHDAWQRYVLFPKDARNRAYEMSAAARELKPYFEGPGGDFWRNAGCNQTKITPCPEILSGWFMWALRDAVANAGYYNNAENSQNFYRRLAKEINDGCKMHPDYCMPERVSLIPPWRDEYMVDTFESSLSVFKTLSTFGGSMPNIHPSEGDQKHLALFDTVTNGPLAPVSGVVGAWGVDTLKSPRDEFRIKIATLLTRWVRPIFSYGLPLVFAVLGIWSIIALTLALKLRRIPIASWWVATSLAVAVTARIVLLGFLEATSIPSNNMLYLLPIVPIAVAMLPVVLWGVTYDFFRFLRQPLVRQNGGLSEPLN